MAATRCETVTWGDRLKERQASLGWYKYSLIDKGSSICQRWAGQADDDANATEYL